MADPHVLVVPDVPVEEGFYPAYQVECPGVTDACRAWWECDRQPGCPPFKPDSEAEEEAEAEGEFTAHGARHRFEGYGFGWVPEGWCWVAGHDSLLEEAHELALGHDLKPGRYPVRVDWSQAMDATELHLELIPEEVDRGDNS